MTADLFLTCFLACMFAFIVFGVLGWQIGNFLLRRWIAKNLPDLISKTLHGATGTSHGADQDTLDELLKNAMSTPPGVTPHLSVVKCRCGREQSVPHEVELGPILLELGWRFHPEKFDGWGCPSCVSDHKLVPNAMKNKENDHGTR